MAQINFAILRDALAGVVGFFLIHFYGLSKPSNNQSKVGIKWLKSK